LEDSSFHHKNGKQTGKRSSLVKNTFVVSGGTTVSRIFGLVREILISSVFGTTWITDAFFIAYIIPNLLRRLFAEGALSTSVVPVFSQYKDTHSREAKEFIASVFTALVLVVSVICAAGIILSPWLVELVAVGFRGDPEKLLLTTRFTQIMFPFLLVISLAALLMGILNTLHIFSWPAIAPVFFNLGIILFILLFYRDIGPYVLAWGVLAGGIGQFAVQLIPFRRQGLSLAPLFSFWKNMGLQQVFRLMLPVTFALAVSQINTLVDRIIASTTREGAVSALYFADRLMELPLGIFGIAIATAILPPLSRYALQKNEDDWSRTLNQGIRYVLFIMLPLSVLLVLFRYESVTLVYERGQFDRQATMMTAHALLYYAPALVFLSLAHVLTRAFYSLKDSKTPVRISVIAVGINIVLDLVLVRFMDFPGLALATTLSAVFNSFFLLFLLHKRSCTLRSDPGFTSWLKKVLLLISIFSAVGWGIHRISGGPYTGMAGMIWFIVFSLALLAGYFLVSRLLGMHEGEALFKIFRGASPVISPENNTRSRTPGN